jgi:hypothetical protein
VSNLPTTYHQSVSQLFRGHTVNAPASTHISTSNSDLRHSALAGEKLIFSNDF